MVELAVHPSFRIKGLGELLVRNLLKDIETKTAILTTQADNVKAQKLYKKLEWETVKENFYTGQDPYVIMGKII